MRIASSPLTWLLWICALVTIINWTTFLSTSIREIYREETCRLSTSAQPEPLDPCRGYDGVLWIRSGDRGAAAGTVFFLYVINHLIYADMHNLLPWIHLDNTSHRIYDSKVHHNGERHSFRMIQGSIPPGWMPGIPLDPTPLSETQLAQLSDMETINFTGNGVWESYFEPVSRFSPAENRTCWTTKPLYEINYNQVVTGLHGEAPWSLQAWLYNHVREEHKYKVMRDWYRPMRKRGALFVRSYVRPKAWLLDAANAANPLEIGQKCIALHVRATDKSLSGARDEIPMSDYLPHAISFLKKSHGNSVVYMATDSAKTMETLKKEWPSNVVKRVRLQDAAVRSSSSDPAFDLASHHRTNSEVLVDIYAMAKCSLLVHGRSSVSEAVLYVNPDMREASVDLEDDSQLMKDIDRQIANE